MARGGDVTLPRLGALGWLRWTWRQLTSMRTALLLLLLLAVAALPGSTFPQRSLDATRTAQWIQAHPDVGPLLDRLGLFEVYAAPWFAAVYLLLLVSLVGCVLPRSRVHWRAMRSAPPRAPSRLERLASSARAEVDSAPQDALDVLRKALRDKRYRVVSHDADTISAEKGYLKETGNLAFHLALIGVIVGVAIGHLLGWKGDVIVPTGQTFGNALINYDTFSPGPLVDPADLSPFTLRVDRMDAKFEQNVRSKGQFGMPRDFTAYTTFTPRPGARPQQRTIRVNGPLETGAGTVYLLGNGYAPRVTVRDSSGRVVYSAATPFLAQDNNYKSVGAIKVPGATPKDLGFSGLFLPTSVIDERGPHSIFPQPVNPELALTAFEGRIFDGSAPQSVYSLDTTHMTQLKDAAGTDVLRIRLRPGQTVTLPGGRGSITFDGVERFAGLSVRADPGKAFTLASALLALLGLIGSLVVRRRRVFVRVTAAEEVGTDGGRGRSVVEVGGLTKDDDGHDEGMDEQLAGLLAALPTGRPTGPGTKDEE